VPEALIHLGSDQIHLPEAIIHLDYNNIHLPKTIIHLDEEIIYMDIRKITGVRYLIQPALSIDIEKC